MNSIKDRLTKTYLSPQGKIARIIDSFVVFIIAVISIYLFYSINYELCIENLCNNLIITKYWVVSSALYIIYGLSALVIAIYLFKTKELPRIYSLAITLVIVTSFVLCAMVFFAIVRELETFI